MKVPIENDHDVVIGKLAGKMCTTKKSQVTSNATADKPMTQKYGFTILDEIDALPLTIKIDFTAFLLFNTCYIFVNLVYWVNCTFN